MNNILEVSGLNKSYGAFQLKDISFTLPENCITGFIGINGAGKTTTIRSQFLNILLEFMQKEGKSVFFSTHITSDLDKVADMIILINDGQIVFEEEKDALLDTFKKVKGNPKELSDETRKLFLSIQETKYGFTGITENAAQIKLTCKNILTEKPTIEDIMLGYIGGK